MACPPNWTVNALERLSQRYDRHAFDPAENASVRGRIAEQLGALLDTRAYGHSVRLEVHMTDIAEQPVNVHMVYNVAGRKIMTVLSAEWQTDALQVI